MDRDRGLDVAAAAARRYLAGVGDRPVWPRMGEDELRAVVEGSGSISYSGNPRVTLSRTDGSGDIERD